MSPAQLKRRDELAEKSVTRYNHKEVWLQYEMRKCGMLSFVEGYDAGAAAVASCNDMLDKMVNVLKAIRSTGYPSQYNKPEDLVRNIDEIIDMAELAIVEHRTWKDETP